MGVEPFLVASSVEAVLAQRLVRRVCAECQEPYIPTADDCPPDLLKELLADVQPGSPTTALVLGKGCRNCRQTGYRGRLGVYELLTLSDRLRELVIERVSAPKLASEARKDKLLCTLREDGVAKARAGLTTAQEVLRALAS
jgi:type II secretory ATPase GspE/PulE/Tfp pilus assembly ATPase PilB-like protein